MSSHDLAPPGPPGGVVVAVLTYRRRDELAALLPELVRQAAGAALPAQVLVVDNDPGASAREVCAPLPVRYVHEPQPGIAAARNRALDEAVESDLLVFVDDDEEPVQGWLDALLRVRADTSPAGVVGPVVSRFTVEPDAWLQAGRFFDRRRLATGSLVDVAATNNLLLDLREVRRRGLRFDLRFGLSGGSDTLFTRQLTGSGGRLVWCDEALVVDVVPADRLTRGWVLRRAVRSGNSWSRVALELAPPGAAAARLRAGLLARGAVRVVLGGLRLVLGLVTHDLGHQARGARAAARGAGLLGGALGQVRSEYERPGSAVDGPPGEGQQDAGVPAQ